MDEEQRDLFFDWFRRCTTTEEVALLYGEALYEMRKTLGQRLSELETK